MKDRSLTLILIGVLAAHALGLQLLVLTPGMFIPLTPPAAPRLVVKTISLQPQEVKETTAVAEIEVKPEPPSVSVEPEPIVVTEKKELKIEPLKIEPLKPLPPLTPESSKPALVKKQEEPAQKPKPTPTPAPKEKSKPAPKPTEQPKEKPKERPKETWKEKLKEKIKAPTLKDNKSTTGIKEPIRVQKTAPPEKDPALKKRQELLANAQKSIAKMEQSRDKLATIKTTKVASANIPGKIDRLQVDSLHFDEDQALSSVERTYYDELGSRLKLVLRLPEFGAVKIKLTLQRSGHFSSVAVVKAESLKNRQYLEKTLPTLMYPGFGDSFHGKENHTFVVTLSNDL